ncbi:MAG: hypothetical protein ACYC61_14360 [Isosphaeraceae bacterium]
MMPPVFVVVCEAKADFVISTELADRVFCDRIDWIEAEMIDAFRQYEGRDQDQHFLTWDSDVPRLSQEMGIRIRGFIGNRPADFDARQAQRALRIIAAKWPEVAGILLIRDDDGLTNRRRGLEQARNESSLSQRVVIGLAHTKRECWVLAGFEPTDDEESARLANVRQQLGFDPRLLAHQLTAKHDYDKKSAKGVLHDLVRGDHDREATCWCTTDLTVLKDRGRETGLTQFLEEVETRLVPVLS